MDPDFPVLELLSENGYPGLVPYGRYGTNPLMKKVECLTDIFNIYIL
jgi:hypothetical protein